MGPPKSQSTPEDNLSSSGFGWDPQVMCFR
jgi:hypothetical protein